MGFVSMQRQIINKYSFLRFTIPVKTEDYDDDEGTGRLALLK